jgi:methylthioribose-1-phosphate isomerase
LCFEDSDDEDNRKLCPRIAYVHAVSVIESVRRSPDGNAVRIIDQRLLPGQCIELDLRDVNEFVGAIQTLAVRGAPAIGVTAALGLSLLASRAAAQERAAARFSEQVVSWAAQLRGARPTAVNLAWAVDRVVSAGARHKDPKDAAQAMRVEADSIRDEDRAMCRSIGEYGASLIEDGMTVLTHCNTGALATAGIGTALAAIYVAHEQKKDISVFASETRPLMQGSRLTAWELSRAGIRVTVITEGAVASLMRAGMIDVCVVGADRIAANGDFANKIGTFSHAVLAAAHGIPFYVAAPRSTVDIATESGDNIEIEERAASELLHPGGASPITGISAYNPAFDVTPASFVSAIVTDAGIHYPPFAFTSQFIESR